MRRLLARLTLVAAAVAGSGGAALAQSYACQSYRAELASLERSGGGGTRSGNAAALAERQRAELARMTSYYRSLGCDRGGFLFFGQPAAPECGPAAQRLRAMEANYQRLVTQATQGDTEYRKAQLRAAIRQQCEGGDSRGFFERLFGGPEPRREDPRLRPPEAVEEGGGEPGPLRASGKPVCVRTCDGFFFPLANNPGGGREGMNELCQALCPGTETALFFLPGDSDLTRAVSVKGQAYVSLPGAFKYTKSFDAACSCRKAGQTWAQALMQAEEMIERRRGDIIVTAQKAEELSRPRAAPPPREARRGQERGQEVRGAEARGPEARTPAQAETGASAAETQAAADTGAAAPTAGGESAGIGPRQIETERVLGTRDGQTRETTTADGAKRTVRIVAPTVIPVPQMRAP